MANNPRTISEAVNETLDVKLQAEKLVKLVNGVLEDGQVTQEEAAAVRDQAGKVFDESVEAFVATREADIGQRIIFSYATRKPVNATLRREAREYGIPIVIMTETTEQTGTEAA